MNLLEITTPENTPSMVAPGMMFQLNAPLLEIRVKNRKSDPEWRLRSSHKSCEDLMEAWESLCLKIFGKQYKKTDFVNPPSQEDTMKNLTIHTLPVGQIEAGENHMTGLTHADFEALRENIEEFGLQRPLIVKPANTEGVYKVVDGAHRLKIAKGLGMEAVPCVILAVEDENEFAIRCAVGNGRQLTQAHKALLAFEQHRAEIQKASDENKGGQPFQKKCLPPHGAEVEKVPFSIAYLEMRRGLRKGDIHTLNKAWGRFCPDNRVTDAWTALRVMIANGAGTGAAIAGVTGKTATEGQTRAEPEHDRLLVEAARVLAMRLEHFVGINWMNAKKDDLYHHLAHVFAKFPEEARLNAVETMAAYWQPEAREAAILKLKNSLAGV